MKFLRRILPLVAILFVFASTVFAQIKDVGIAEDVITDQPTWIANPIGSIIGLILLIAMFAGMAKAALAKE